MLISKMEWPSESIVISSRLASLFLLMPPKYSDQVFLTATHLINHTPSKTLDYDTHLHQILEATPDYINLRIFGCAC
jgi:hypothetical protein